MATTAAGYDWKDATCMGGDELRTLDAWELASLLSDALRVASDPSYTPAWHASARQAAERVTYYLDVARCGESAAVAMLRAREDLAY